MTLSREEACATVELSTVYFYRGELPPAIALRDCSLELAVPMHGLFCALYGKRSKQDGFMAAHAYAERNGLQFTVVDLTVALSLPINPMKMALDDLPQHELLPLNQARKELLDEVQGCQDDVAETGLRLRENPALIGAFLDAPRARHVRVAAFDCKPAMAAQLLTVGVIPYRHWRAIESAICRLDPNTRVSLASPDRDAEARRPAVRAATRRPMNKA